MRTQYNIVRDLNMVARIENGETLQAVGYSQKPKISRERVRQIYRSITGKSVVETGYRKKMAMLRENKLNEVSFVCRYCKKRVLVKDKNGRKVICDSCSPVVGEKLNLKIVCSGCGKLFKPKYNQMHNPLRDRYSGKLYHSRKCFYKHGVKK